MSKPTLSARILEKLKNGPDREVKSVLQYLRRDEFRFPPQPEEGSVYSVIINQVTDLLELLQDFKLLLRLVDRFAEAQEIYQPSFPPRSPVSNSYFFPHLYFDQPYGESRETLGSICLELGRAYRWHPKRLLLLENLCKSSHKVLVHEGKSNGHTKFTDLLTGAKLLAQNFSGYVGKKQDLIWARVLPSPTGESVEEIITTPYLLKSGQTEWRSYFERNPNPEQLKFPAPWTYWLEFILQGYSGHREDAISLTGVPDQPETRPHSSKSANSLKASRYSLAQRWSPGVVRESPKSEAWRAHLVLLVDEIEGTVCKVEPTKQKLSPQQISDWLQKHSLPPEGSELWVDQAALQAHLCEQLPAVKCRFQDELPELERLLQSLSQQLERDSNSVVNCLGKSRAREFFRTAHSFFRKEPWKQLECHQVLAYRNPKGVELGVNVMGSGGEEYGLSVFSSPEQALEVVGGTFHLPILGICPAPTYSVPSADLNLLDQENLQSPDGQYLWVISPKAEKLSANLLQDLEWLLREIPSYAHSQEPVSKDGYRLEIIEPDPLDEVSFAGLFLHFWQRDSEVAQHLAELFSDFALEALSPEPGAKFSGRLTALAEIGQEYLRTHGRKRKILLDYFVQLPHQKLPREQLAVAKKLSKYLATPF